MADLRLGLLGPLEVTRSGAPVAQFESDKARALLAYLAVEADRPHRRESLIGLLWPDSPEEAARRNLRQTLYNLRQAIGDHAADPPYLLVSREQIQFNRASDYELDVKTFESLLNSCEKNHHPCAELCPLRTQWLQQGLTLYRGEFLDQFFVADSAPFEEWAVRQRESLHRRALEALDYLARYQEREGAYEEARRYAQQALALDPWREEAHRQVMRTLALAGRRSEALAQYESCRRVLAEELGVEPSAETRALYEQIRREALTAGPQPPRGPAVRARSLPVFPTPFIGRERELADLSALLSDPACRLITLVGPGGTGKTRLALEVAEQNGPAFADGAAFVPLAAVDSVDAVVPAIADALSFSLHGAGDPRTYLLDYLSAKHLLLTIDNVEQLPDAAELWAAILSRAPQVKLLITSRETLNLTGEFVFSVEGLQVPTGHQAEVLESFSAARLFLERARRAHVGFTLRPDERAAVVRLCQLLDGVPLALELAATWVHTLSCTEIVQEIEHSLDFLAASMRDLAERHRSMRAVCDQSWRLLSAEERTVLRALSVFRGGFSRKSALAVTGASLPLLSTLLSKSLIHRVESSRYNLHEHIRQYAEERLREAGGFGDACARHAQFFLAMAESAEPKLVGADQVAWLDHLDREHDNLRVMLERLLKRVEPNGELNAAERQSAADALLRAAAALSQFWKRRDHWTEGREWLERVLSAAAWLPPSQARARALNGAVLLAVEQADIEAAAGLSAEQLAISATLTNPYHIAAAVNAHGYLLWKQKDFARARARCEEALQIFRELGDRWQMAESLHYLGHIATNQGDYAAARDYLDESRSLYDQMGDKLGLNFSVNDLGLIAYLADDHATAGSFFESALHGFLTIGSRPGMVSALNGLGDLARYAGQYRAAREFYAEALDLYRAMGDRDEIPSLLHNLGYVEQHDGDPTKALLLFRGALAMQRDNRNQAGMAECIAGIAALLAEKGDARESAQLLGAAESLRQSAGAFVWPANRVEHEQMLSRVHQQLDAEAFAEAWAAGQSMTPIQALGLALNDDDHSSAGPRHPSAV